MNIDFQEQIPAGFQDNSKVWIYQCNRLFALIEALQIEEILEQFTAGWQSHSQPVKGFANLFFGQFIVLMADETQTSVGGCSIDSSVKMIKEIEQKFNVSMFDRQLLAFIIKDKIQMLPLSQLNYAIEKQFIDAGTPYFNNTILTKKELMEDWIIPVNKSWLGKKLPQTIQ